MSNIPKHKMKIVGILSKNNVLDLFYVKNNTDLVYETSSFYYDNCYTYNNILIDVMIFNYLTKKSPTVTLKNCIINKEIVEYMTIFDPNIKIINCEVY